jgi:uncharacterized membrane protein YbaN (DUF454 family)
MMRHFDQIQRWKRIALIFMLAGMMVVALVSPHAALRLFLAVTLLWQYWYWFHTISP